MKSDEKEIGIALCWRCENRAIFRETGYQPRFECGMEKTATSCCYMFIPAKPVAVAPVANEKRPIFGPWMIAGRVRAQGLVGPERLRLKVMGIDKDSVAAVWTIRKPMGTKKGTKKIE